MCSVSPMELLQGLPAEEPGRGRRLGPASGAGAAFRARQPGAGAGAGQVAAAWREWEPEEMNIVIG